MFVALQYWGKQGDLLRALAPIKERITPQIVLHTIDSLGVPLHEFQKNLSDENITKYVDSSRAEALRNQVNITPTFFINKKRYTSYKDARWIIDAADYEHEKIQNRSKSLELH